MKQKEGRQAIEVMEARTTCGGAVKVHSKGEVVFLPKDSRLSRYSVEGGLTVAFIRRIKKGAVMVDPRTQTRFIIADITKPFSKEFVQSIGGGEKRSQLSRDIRSGLLISSVPTLLVWLAEKFATSARINDSTESVTDLLNSLPFPVLYDLFESAPEPVRLWLAPILLGLGFLIVSGQLVGRSIHKARTPINEVKLRNHFKDKNVNTANVIGTFREYSEHNTAKQARLNTKEDFARA